MVLALAACTGPSPIPPLPPGSPEGTRLVLDDELTAADVKAIFRSLNRSGRLDPLKPYFETPSEAALAPVARLLSTYFYEDAFDREGLPALLQLRAEAGDFTRWRNFLRTAPDRDRATSLLAAFLLHPEMDVWLDRALGLLDPELAEAWATAALTARDDFEPRLPFTGREVTRPEAVADLARFLTDDRARAALDNLAARLADRELARGVLTALSRLRRAKGSAPAEGFAAGLSRMAATPALEGLLAFFLEIDGPTNGLFSVAQDKLRREPHAVRTLATYVDNLVPRAVRGFAREALAAAIAAEGIPEAEFHARLRTRANGLPSAQWVKAFIAIRGAVENVAGPVADDTENDHLLRNLPIYLNTYVLTRWLESRGPLALDLLAPEVKADWQALGLGDFALDVEEAAARPGFGEFIYDLPEGLDLAGAVERVHAIRPFAQGAALVRALAFGITRDEGGLGFQLADLESENLATELNEWLATLSLPTWRRFQRLVFDDLSLGDPPDDVRDLLLSLYDGHPALRARVERLLAGLRWVPELDRREGELPSALEAYHAVLRSLPPEDVGTLTAVLRFVGEAGLLRYPTVVRTLENREGLARFLHGLSGPEGRPRETLIRGLEGWLGGGGAALTYRLLRELHGREPEGMAVALGFVLDTGWDTLPFPDVLSAPERRWLTRFIATGDFAVLRNFANAHGGRRELRALGERLGELQRSGYLGEGLDLLAHIQNERLQRLSRTLESWDGSGELGSLLDTLTSLVPAP